MGDQQKWFKLWYAALADESLQQLTPAERWAWAALGAYTKIHGQHGVVRVSPANIALASMMCIAPDQLQACIERFPNVTVSVTLLGRDGVTLEEANSRYGELTVTWTHWRKYQEDSTSGERMRRLRARAALRSKRRRDKKRIELEEETLPPITPPSRGMHASGNGTDPAASGRQRTAEARELLAFLNRRTGHGYQATKSTLERIRARLDAGATPDQIRYVIVSKWREWRGTEMAKYLRPETLFRASKFDSYLGQLPQRPAKPNEEI